MNQLFHLYDYIADPLFEFGNVSLYTENEKTSCNCWQNDNCFNYHGIENALCGKEKNEYGFMYFIPKRILIIQMI